MNPNHILDDNSILTDTVQDMPKTELGKRLYALRTKAILEGMELLSEDEVIELIKRCRVEDLSEEDL